MIQGRILSATIIALTMFGAVSRAEIVPQEAVPGEYVVRLKNEVNVSKTDLLQSLNAESVRDIVPQHQMILVKRNLLEVQSFALDSLNANPKVQYAEPNFVYRINRTPNDPKLEDLWGLKNSAQKGGKAGVDIGAEAAWDFVTGSQSVLVAVIDTGLDYTHPDLIDNSWTNEAELNGKPGVDDDGNGYVDDIHGYDFVNNDGDPMDDHGHGTHVSGTIGAKGNDGKGIVGVAWDVKIAGVKFLSGSGSGTLENAVRAIHYATTIGAHIQSNSWGGGGYTQALFDVIQEAEKKNIIFTAAAGNDSRDIDQYPSYPASYQVPNVIAVAAINNKGELAYFSNYGRESVHVAAPGEDIVSSLPMKLFPEGYAAWSGTSMATPHISGIAALMLAKNPNYTYQEVKDAIIAGSVELGSLRAKTISRGGANAYYAVTGEAPPKDMEDPYNWEKTSYQMSSIHPYEKNSTLEYIVKLEGAKEISVYFEKFETENNYDTVEFFDSQNQSLGIWSGKHSGEFSPKAVGDTMRIVLTSDDTVEGYGFDISKIAFR